MLTVFTLISTVVIFSIVNCVYADFQNETAKNENDNDFAGSGAALAGNITANFSVSASGVDEKISNFSGEAPSSNVSITDRNGNQEAHVSSRPAIEFNAPSAVSTKPKKLDFRPSPQLETYYEYNKFPVKPAVPEAKMIRNFGNINSQDFAVGEVLPAENTDRQTSRNLNSFEPALSAFGTPHFQNERSQNGLSKNVGGTRYNNNEAPNTWTSQTGVNEVNRKNENDDTPWVSRVRFPQKPISNDSPYAFVPNPGSDPNTNNFNNNALSPPKNNEYLPPPGANNNNRYPPLTNKQDFPKNNNYNNVNTNNKVGYLPPTPNYGFTGGGQGYTSVDPSGANNEEYNFNKYVEVPQTYYPGPPNTYPHQPTYDTYNIMEKPSSETQHKTFGGSYTPWKKILKLLATFIPIGLLISALTPTVITVTSVNDTSTSAMAATRYRSSDEPKKELTSHIISSLDYFDKLNENGCEYRVFCELLVSASHMPNSKQHVEDLLDNFAEEELDYKSRAEELRKVFAAVRSHDCNSVPCEFIKNPT